MEVISFKVNQVHQHQFASCQLMIYNIIIMKEDYKIKAMFYLMIDMEINLKSTSKSKPHKRRIKSRKTGKLILMVFVHLVVHCTPHLQSRCLIYLPYVRGYIQFSVHGKVWSRFYTRALIRTSYLVQLWFSF